VAALVALLLVAGCQPHTRRALLLDLALSDEALVAGTAEPWAAAGYVVDYRRFYPHLTHADVARYGVIVLLAGRSPERWSDALGVGDLALLIGWVPRGGVLVLGYAGDDEGSLDRWVINRFLHATGTGIRVGSDLLRDTSRAHLDPPGAHPPARVASGPLGLVRLEEFPAGRNHPLAVRRAAQALARAPATAFVRRHDTLTAAGRAPLVAASRVGRGLVVVTSRHLLAALGPELRGTPLSALTRDSLDAARRFLVALARWTRRPAEWAAVPGAEARAPLVLERAPAPIAARAPPLAPPASAGVTRLRAPAAPIDPVAAAPPEWLARPGMRIGWSRAALADPARLSALLGFLDAADLNLLVSPAPEPTNDSLRRAGGDPADLAWREARQRLGATSVRWFPSLPLLPPGPGQDRCLLDEPLWSDWIGAALRRLTTHTVTRTDPLAGVAFELPTETAPPQELCDSNLHVALTRLGWDQAAIDRVMAASAPERYEALLTSGALGDYVMALEVELGARAARVARDARRTKPNLLFALWSAAPAADWRAYGLARGLGADGTPVLVWDPEAQAATGRAAHRRRGVTMLHALGLPVDALPTRAWNRLRPVVFGWGDGFWIGPVERFVDGPRVPTDSLARLVRRFTRAP
jgi:hypothetical protein